MAAAAMDDGSSIAFLALSVLVAIAVVRLYCDTTSRQTAESLGERRLDPQANMSGAATWGAWGC
jgi:hypothetical protein